MPENSFYEGHTEEEVYLSFMNRIGKDTSDEGIKSLTEDMQKVFRERDVKLEFGGESVSEHLANYPALLKSGEAPLKEELEALPEKLKKPPEDQQLQKRVGPRPLRRPEMPEFMKRTLLDENGRPRHTPQQRVVNRTETALPLKERLSGNIEDATPNLTPPSAEIAALAAMQMDPPLHLLTEEGPVRRPANPSIRTGLPRRRPVSPFLRKTDPQPTSASEEVKSEQKASSPIARPRPPFRRPPPRRVQPIEPIESAKEPEVVTEVASGPAMAAAPAKPEVEDPKPSDICGDRKFPRKEANSLAEEVIRHSKIRELVQTVNDMHLSDESRDRIEGEVKLAIGKKTFDAWLTVDFDSERRVSAMNLGHWEYGLDRPVKFDRIDFVGGEFKKGDQKTPPAENVEMSIRPGEPITPPKAKMVMQPPQGLTPPGEKPKQVRAGMSR